jgi:hypothetical protein
VSELNQVLVSIDKTQADLHGLRDIRDISVKSTLFPILLLKWGNRKMVGRGSEAAR